MIATTVGAIAGAVIGAKAEEKIEPSRFFRISDQKDNGQEIVVVQKYDQSLVPGARVRIVGGSKVNVSVIH